MDHKALSLNLMLKKKGSPDAFQPKQPSTPDTSETVLERYVPRPALEAFPDWQGLLIKSAVLAMNVWVVRTHQEGEELAKETGHPALLLDDVLRQKGKTLGEARESLLPLLIVGTVQ